MGNPSGVEQGSDNSSPDLVCEVVEQRNISPPFHISTFKCAYFLELGFLWVLV